MNHTGVIQVDRTVALDGVGQSALDLISVRRAGRREDRGNAQVIPADSSSLVESLPYAMQIGQAVDVTGGLISLFRGTLT